MPAGTLRKQPCGHSWAFWDLRPVHGYQHALHCSMRLCSLLQCSTPLRTDPKGLNACSHPLKLTDCDANWSQAVQINCAHGVRAADHRLITCAPPCLTVIFDPDGPCLPSVPKSIVWLDNHYIDFASISEKKLDFDFVIKNRHTTTDLVYCRSQCMQKPHSTTSKQTWT